MTKLPFQALSNEVNANVFLGGLTGSLTGSLRPCSKSEINERGDLRDYSEAKEMQAMLPERPSSENRDDIIRMAGEAGFGFPADYDLTELISRLERFAALVAAAEREACAKVCYELPWKDMGHIPSNLAFTAAIRARGNK